MVWLILNQINGIELVLFITWIQLLFHWSSILNPLRSIFYILCRRYTLHSSWKLLKCYTREEYYIHRATSLASVISKSESSTFVLLYWVFPSIHCKSSEHRIMLYKNIIVAVSWPRERLREPILQRGSWGSLRLRYAPRVTELIGYCTL